MVVQAPRRKRVGSLHFAMWSYRFFVLILSSKIVRDA